MDVSRDLQRPFMFSAYDLWPPSQTRMIVVGTPPVFDTLKEAFDHYIEHFKGRALSRRYMLKPLQKRDFSRVEVVPN